MRRRRETFGALVLYTLITLAFTWPLARGLARDVPGDFGDPLLNAWIISWDDAHVARALGGHASALAEYWNPGIFAPHPLALAYSEHLTAQALQVFPIYLMSGNPILCYNLLFLSTFVLSAFGMFLFIRELTGSAGAGCIAGLAFGFAPYRVAAIPHLQVLSTAWMPLSLFFFRRFFDSRSATLREPQGRPEQRRVATASAERYLAFGAIAWLLQNLSCGYYLLFFSPIVVLYLAWEVTARGLWKNARIVGRIGVMVAAVAAATLPMLWPYLQLRRLGFPPRPIAEVVKFSADVYGFLTANEALKVWGSVARAWPASEGELFPGLAVTILASLALLFSWWQARDGTVAASPAARAIGWLCAISLVLGVFLLSGGSIRIPAQRPVIKITAFWREMTVFMGLLAALIAMSDRARTIARRMLASPAGFFAAITLVSAFMALGPVIRARGRVVEDAAPYSAFYRSVPGADGLRVPARFGMIVAFGLAGLAGLAAATLSSRRDGARAVAAVGALMMLESWAAPITINYNDVAYKQSGLEPLPAALSLGREAPPVYGFITRLPATATVLELPLGEPQFDVRYMMYSLDHGRSLVNGYSGGAPLDYQLLNEALRDVLTNSDRAWSALESSAATHVVVHEAFYQAPRGAGISAWLAARGAREVEAFGSDRVFSIR